MGDAMNINKSRAYVDFGHVDERHAAIHERLQNWARACRSSGGNSASPMFRLYRTSDHWRHATSCPVFVDQADAVRIAKGVQALPEPHMHATNWAYLTNGNITEGRKKLACTAAALHQYVMDARQMLINRNV